MRNCFLEETEPVNRGRQAMFICIWLSMECLRQTAPALLSAPSVQAIPESQVIQQFSSEGQVVGFLPDGWLLSNGYYALQVHFAGASPQTPVVESKSRITVSHPKGLPELGAVRYENLWPGIQAVFEKPAAGIVKSTYTVQAGIGRPEQIRLRYNVPIHIDAEGNLLLSLAQGQLREDRPIAWQWIAGKKRMVPVRYVVRSAQELGFSVVGQDPDCDLVIDPVLAWNTFAGSSSTDIGYGVYLDGSGNVYVTGKSLNTWGSNPVNPHSNTYYDAFVVKYDPDGVKLWNTFLGAGGGYEDSGVDVIADGAGNVYVAGYSTGTWGGNPLNPFCSGSTRDAFLARLNSSGTKIWHTFLGGSLVDNPHSLAFGGNDGSILISGYSASPWGSPKHDFNGSADAFVAKYNSEGALQWNTFHGCFGSDYGRGVISDGAGNIYLTGTSFATWGNPVNSFIGENGVTDAFVAKLNSSGILQWNTFLGGASSDEGYGIAVDGAGSIFVTGTTFGSWGNPLNPYSGLEDGFLAKLNSDGSRSWHTYIGSSVSDFILGIALDGTGKIYIAGRSYAAWGDPLNAFSGAPDLLIAKFDLSGIRQWHTFLGGINWDYSYNLSLSGNAISIAGMSSQTWGNPLNPYSGAEDAVTLKVYFAPALSGLDPVSATAGGSSFLLTANGTGFTNGSTLRWDGADRATTYVSPTRLTATILKEDILSGKSVSIRVYNSAPDNELSNSLTYTIYNPVPEIRSLSHTVDYAGAPQLTLGVNGANFVPASVVRCNGHNRATTFISGIELSVVLVASDVSASGTLTIDVYNPEPGGGLSAEVRNLTLYEPRPGITSLIPSSALSGGSAFTLLAKGIGFVNGSLVRWNGSNRPTTYISWEQLSASILASDISSSGTASITVYNPLGGGSSDTVLFNINNPLPVISNLNPSSVMARGAAITLTVSGTGFVPGSVLQWNGSNRKTTFVSGSQLTAEITAIDIASTGTAYVTVFNPSPGGGTSEPETAFPILAPGKKAWTFLLYLDGDNNLYQALASAVAGMEARTFSPDINVVVQLDGPASGDTWRFLVQKGGVYTAELNRWFVPEPNMGAKETLIGFVDWAQKEFPADYYYLAITDHGRGTQGIAWDTTSSNQYLTTRELRSALSTLYNSSNTKIQVLHLDACLMAMLEVACQVREYAEYMVASENLGWSVFAYSLYVPTRSARENAEGADWAPLTYARVLEEVNSTTTPRDLAVSIVESYHNHPALKNNPRTISALDLSKAPEVRQALDDWAEEMRLNLETLQDQRPFKEKIQDRRLVVQKFDSRDYGRLTVEDEYVDLYDLADQIRKVATIGRVAGLGQILMDAALGMVVAERHQSGSYSWQGDTPGNWNLDEAHGISLYFPPRSGTNTYNSYINSDQLFQMTVDGKWDDFLKAYFGAMSLGVDPATDPTLPPVLFPQLKLYLPLILK